MRLEWHRGTALGTVVLNPDNPCHQSNMDDLPVMEALILKAYLEETVLSINRSLERKRVNAAN